MAVNNQNVKITPQRFLRLLPIPLNTPPKMRRKQDQPVTIHFLQNNLLYYLISHNGDGFEKIPK